MHHKLKFCAYRQTDNYVRQARNTKAYDYTRYFPLRRISTVAAAGAAHRVYKYMLLMVGKRGGVLFIYQYTHIMFFFWYLVLCSWIINHGELSVKKSVQIIFDNEREPFINILYPCPGATDTQQDVAIECGKVCPQKRVWPKDKLHQQQWRKTGAI